LASDYLSLTLNRWGWMGASHIVNTHTIDARVGGRSRYPGRVPRGPVADVGGAIAEADRLRRAGALPQARQVLQRAVEVARAVPGVDQAELCAARRILAEVMCELGERDGACEVLTELLADSQASFGPCHPASVRTLAVLAAVVHELGDFDAAERLYREVGGRIGEKQSRAGSLVRVRLALLQRDRGNLDAAREEMAEAYQKHKEAFGGEDADTANIAAQLAELHRDAGDSATARRILTVAYVATCSSLGEDHEVTRRLESDLEALEPPMPSAPIDLPEDSQSTRSIKRRHSKKSAAAVEAAEAMPPAVKTPAAPLPAAPASPAAPSWAVTPSWAAAPAPVSPAPARPVPQPPHAVAPSSPAPARPAAFASPARPAAFAPAARPAALASPARPAAFAPAARPAAAPPPARASQIPAQTRRRVAEPEFSGRRTHPGQATGYSEPLSSQRLAALAAAETVVTSAVVVDPVAAPRAAGRPKRSAAATVLVVLMVIVAIGGGVALAAIGAMLAMGS
jgi:tetratricopeptide (TPR) repeat protein